MQVFFCLFLLEGLAITSYDEITIPDFTFIIRVFNSAANEGGNIAHIIKIFFSHIHCVILITLGTVLKYSY